MTWIDNVGQSVNAAYLNSVDAGLAVAATAMQAADLAAAQLTTINAQTANYTLVIGDNNKAVEINKATAATLTVPLNATVPFPIGTSIEVVQIGAGQVTVTATGGVTLNFASTASTRLQWSAIGLRKRATDTWLITGDTA